MRPGTLWLTECLTPKRDPVKMTVCAGSFVGWDLVVNARRSLSQKDGQGKGTQGRLAGLRGPQPWDVASGGSSRWQAQWGGFRGAGLRKGKAGPQHGLLPHLPPGPAPGAE